MYDIFRHGLEPDHFVICQMGLCQFIMLVMKNVCSKLRMYNPADNIWIYSACLRHQFHLRTSLTYVYTLFFRELIILRLTWFVWIIWSDRKLLHAGLQNWIPCVRKSWHTLIFQVQCSPFYEQWLLFPSLVTDMSWKLKIIWS